MSTSPSPMRVRVNTNDNIMNNSHRHMPRQRHTVLICNSAAKPLCTLLMIVEVSTVQLLHNFWIRNSGQGSIGHFQVYGQGAHRSSFHRTNTHSCTCIKMLRSRFAQHLEAGRGEAQQTSYPPPPHTHYHHHHHHHYPPSKKIMPPLQISAHLHKI